MQRRDHRVADILAGKGQNGGQFIAAPFKFDAQKPDIGNARGQPSQRIIAARGDDMGGIGGAAVHRNHSCDCSIEKDPVAVATGLAASLSVAVTRMKATERVT